MHLAALTGSIGCGKTTVLRFFQQQGIPTIDCDAIVQALYRQPAVREKLLRLFGTAEKGRVAGIAFSFPKKRKQLEAALHPLVWQKVQERVQGLEKGGKRVAVVDVPLLFEAGWQNRFDSIIAVNAAREQCIERARQNGLRRKEAEARFQAQIPLKEKVKNADFVIDNIGSLEKTRSEVERVASKLREGGSENA